MPENDDKELNDSLAGLAREFLQQLPEPQNADDLADWFITIAEAAIGLGMSIGVQSPATARKYLETSNHKFTQVSTQLIEDINEAVGDFR